MRRSFRPGVAALAVLAAFALPAAARAAGNKDLQCNGTYTGTWASVTVPAGGTCNLSRATILGDAMVQAGGQLYLNTGTTPNSGSSIAGNVTVGSNGTLDQSAGWMVGGTITAQGASFLIVSGGTTHDIRSSATANVEVYDTTVNGSIVADQTQNFANISANISIAGGVTITSTSSSASGVQIEGQFIGGSVYFNGNRAPTNVFLNTIHGNLTCTANNPPTGDFGGYGNYVQGNEYGQCARLTSSPADGAGSA